MVARADAEPNDVRARSLAAATRLFAERGFDGTSIQLIADAVGVSKPAVLHHFPSKEDLRRAVLDSIFLHWQGVLPRLLLAATASSDRFDAVFGELHRFFASEPDRARLVARELFDRPGDVKKMLRGAVRPWLSAIAAYIKEGQAHGRHWEDVDPEAYVVHIMQLVVCATASANVCRVAIDPEGDARARYDKELARIARASLFKPAPSPAPQRERGAQTRQPPQARSREDKSR
ncbi:MAG: TetR/AcrR family transcriptional regulator [Polyangiaceae bacterium]|jgi:TetR/AcrR family transcriptional regulator